MGNSFFGRSFGHTYSVVSVGLKKNVDKSFYSREEATDYMYKIIAKQGLAITKIYDDKHDKTYSCGDSVKFFIQRD